MARILRRDNIGADLNPVKGHEQAGFRPVLIISHDLFNERSGTVIAVALTRQPQRAGYPLVLSADNPKLPKKSWIKISQIRTLSVQRLGKKITRVSPKDMNKVIEGLLEIIGD